MSNNVVDAREKDKKTPQQTQGTEKTIYIGVFFDGTGNNKFQVMLGKLFRGKQAASSNVHAWGADGKPRKISEIREAGRDFWETTGIFSKSQLDEFFFGYEGAGKDTYFVENSDHLAMLTEQKEPIEDKEVKTTKKQMEEIRKGRNEFELSTGQEGMSDKEWKKYKDHEGGDVQKSTYTNVAILEAVYKTDPDYYPVYVEGVGTDMKNGNLDYYAGGTGRGSLGVFEKVKQAKNAVSRIANKYVIDRNISKVHIKMFTFGFSRGATESRMFSYDFIPDNKKDADFLLDSKIDKELSFVGLFDTVASVTYYDTQSLHLYGIDKAKRVVHLCAMDEFRSHFPLTDISSAIGQGLELFLPGCHSDIGGGVDLGVDRWRQIDSHQVAAGFCLMNKWNHNNRNEYERVSVRLLKEIGWIPEGAISSRDMEMYMSEELNCEKYGAIYESGKDSVSIRKYIAPGYTNIPLKLMKAAVSKHEINPLNAIPVSYSIKGSLLKSLFNSWNSMVGGNGQKFATLTDAQYKELRSYHLHYSGNDSFSVNGAVNSVEHEQISANEALITRRIFYGKNQKEKSYFLSHLN